MRYVPWILGSVGGALVLSVVLAAASAQTRNQEPLVLESTKPLYAKVALSPDKSTILSIVFDESRGTGKGYDVAYMTTAATGLGQDARRVPARTRTYGATLAATFEPATFMVPVNVVAGTSAQRNDAKVEVGFAFTQTQSTASREASRRVIATFERNDGEAAWEYAYSGALNTGLSEYAAPITAFDAKPLLTLTTKPNEQKSGETGIGITVLAGPYAFDCKRNGNPVNVELTVKDAAGKTVKQDSETVDKFAFG